MQKIPRPQPQMMGPCTETAKLAADLMSLTTSAHKLHLKVTGPGSDAAHRALGAFYDGMPDLVDKVVEQYQGAREKLLDIPEGAMYRCSSPMEAVSHLKEVYNQVNELQKLMPFSEVTNQLDEIKSLIASTKYKLMFLQ